MKLNATPFLISLLICSMTACGKKETAPQAKTEAQLAAEQKAIEVRAAKDQAIAVQNEAARLKIEALKEASTKKATEPPKSQ